MNIKSIIFGICILFLMVLFISLPSLITYFRQNDKIVCLDKSILIKIDNGIKINEGKTMINEYGFIFLFTTKKIESISIDDLIDTLRICIDYSDWIKKTNEGGECLFYQNQKIIMNITNNSLYKDYYGEFRRSCITMDIFEIVLENRRIRDE